MTTTFENHGNHEILDFVNTLGNRFYQEEADRLQSHEDLLAFCQEFGLLSEEDAQQLVPHGTATQQEVLTAARYLRELLFEVFVQIADRADTVRPDVSGSDAVYELGRSIHSAEQARVLAVSEEKLVWRWQDPRDPMRPVAELALAAKHFISTCDHKRLRKCAAHDCGVLFLDRSRSGRRQWCSMSECGNRSKVSRFRTRQASGTA